MPRRVCFPKIITCGFVDKDDGAAAVADDEGLAPVGEERGVAETSTTMSSTLLLLSLVLLLVFVLLLFSFFCLWETVTLTIEPKFSALKETSAGSCLEGADDDEETDEDG